MTKETETAPHKPERYQTNRIGLRPWQHAFLSGVGWGGLGWAATNAAKWVANVFRDEKLSYNTGLKEGGIMGVAALLGSICGWSIGQKADVQYERNSAERQMLRAENDMLRSQVEWTERTGKKPSALMTDMVAKQRTEAENQEKAR